MMMLPTVLTVRDWHQHRATTGEVIHVLMNGEDISARCREANLAAGTAVCFVLRDGQPCHEDDGRTAVLEELWGDLAFHVYASADAYVCNCGGTRREGVPAETPPGWPGAPSLTRCRTRPIAIV